MSAQDVEPSRRPTWPAALTLFVLAALIPETVATYNSPPLLLLTRPVVLPFLCAFYGSVALCVREFIRRRPARWASVLLLGMAAGCVNEGVIAGTWYRVQYHGYTLIGGVNPAVAVGLTVFHTLYSTLIPILLVELMFPRLAGDRWLGWRGLTACSVLLALVTASGFGRAADRGAKAVVLLGVVLMAATALALPGPAARPESLQRESLRPAPGLGRLRLIGAIGTIAFFVLFAIVPGILGSVVPRNRLPGWQILIVIGMCGFFGLVVTIARSLTGRAGWGGPQTLAVITGALLPTIVSSLVLPAALAGLEPLATVPMLVLLYWLARRDRPVLSHAS